MVINIKSDSVEDKHKVLDALKNLGVAYSVFNNSWDCYVTDELKVSVPIYYKDNSSDYVDKLTEECIDRAIGNQDELLPGDILYDFIDSVSKDMCIEEE